MNGRSNSYTEVRGSSGSDKVSDGTVGVQSYRVSEETRTGPTDPLQRLESLGNIGTDELRDRIRGGPEKVR